jgi:hypothetical protein
VFRPLPRPVAFIVLLLAAVAAGAANAPVVVAIDTSRSLSEEDLRRVTGAVGDLLVKLPAGTPAGLLRFADSPQWMERPGVTPAQVGAALAELRPEGRFTLLHDAVFEAAQALPAGGTVLLVSDGRDENSATTIDDIARICERRGIRIFTAAAGAQRNEKVLRRLSLLTGGEYLGSISELGAADAAAKFGAAARAVESPVAGRSGAASSQPSTVAEPPRPAPAPAAEEPSRAPAPAGGTSPLVWGFGAGLVAAAIAAAMTWRSRRRAATAPAACARCGKTLQPGESGDCATCREAVLLDDLKRRPVAPPGSGVEAFMDPGVFPQMSLEERLEKTFVMQEVPVLEVREPGEPPRSFQLSSEQAFSIGRSPQRASLAIPDPTLSAEHFRIVPHADGFYLLDLGSTNGTLRAGERLRAARLRPGDRLQAGQEEFVFTVKQQARSGGRASATARA